MDKNRTETFISAADLSAKNGYVVVLNGAVGFNKQAKVAISGANAAKAVGVIVDGGRQSGDEVTVAVSGRVESAKIGGNVTVGDYLKADSNGALVTTAGSGDNNVVGQALGTGVDGDFIPVELKFFVY